MNVSLSLSASIERWPTAGTFTIARGAKTHVDVIVVEVDDGKYRGRGEATPIYYRGETAETCLAKLQAFAKANPACDRDMVQEALPPGAARNALDCALWDWEAARVGQPLWQYADLPAPRPLTTAFTLSLDTPAAMEAAAYKAAPDHCLLKLKLGGDSQDHARVAAVHRGAPEAKLIVDANESWDGQDVAALAAELLPYGVGLIEQPVPHGKDEQLRGIASPIPLCADESCHVAADVPHLVGCYDAVNIKLDKAGGLSEAIKLADAADAAGMALMVGCMLSTSLAIAPAFALAQRAQWVDLDGPLLLERDRDNAFIYRDGCIWPQP